MNSQLKDEALLVAPVIEAYDSISIKKAPVTSAIKHEVKAVSKPNIYGKNNQFIFLSPQT